MKNASLYLFEKVGQPIPLATIEDASRARGKKAFVWLNFVDPEKDELAGIIPAFGIHPLSVDDCFDEDQIPKIDEFDDYSSILLNDLDWRDGEGASVVELNAFLGRDFLITVMRGDTANDCPESLVISTYLRGEAPASRKSANRSPARILHVILDRVVDLKFESVEKIGDLIAEMEDRILAGKKADPASVQAIRRNLLVVRKSLYHEREVLEELCRKDGAFVPADTAIYFSDIYDHLAKFSAMVETHRETITNLAQMQLAIAGNEMTESANRTNRSVNRLTVITTICMPLSLIAGIGGMSEWTMITGPENWPVAYAALIAGMALLGFGNYLLIRRLNRKRDKNREE